LLAPRATTVDIWQTHYEQVMPDTDAIVEWVKGRGLRPCLEALPEAERPQYLAAYREAIASTYCSSPDGIEPSRARSC
jgi:trans-aconitate 2-methyltransferase